MGPQSDDVEQNNEVKEMEFKALEPLLQQCYSNNDLQVVDYIATKLLPAGENYGSIMVKIDAKIRKNKSAKEETLHLVGKTRSGAERVISSWPLTFKKELFMYTEIIPFYRELERQVGIAEKDLINILPRFIGYRNSLKNNAIIDGDSVFLMENLKVKGYYNENKENGMDVNHARKALISLARYHALGIVIKQKQPAFAKKAIAQADILAMEYSHLDGGNEIACELLTSIPSVKKHSAVLKSTFEAAKDGGMWKTIPTEPWATITHGDFWTNNMLFHKDEQGNIDDLKLIDFQSYRYSSPLKDVAVFVGCSIDAETQANHLHELLNLYYDVFLKTLERMGCDSSRFTRESFDHEVKIRAISEFPFNVLALKFFTSDIIDENASNEENVDNVLSAKLNDRHIKRLLWLVEIFERMQWF